MTITHRRSAPSLTWAARLISGRGLDSLNLLACPHDVWLRPGLRVGEYCNLIGTHGMPCLDGSPTRLCDYQI